MPSKPRARSMSHVLLWEETINSGYLTSNEEPEVQNVDSVVKRIKEQTQQNLAILNQCKRLKTISFKDTLQKEEDLLEVMIEEERELWEETDSSISERCSGVNEEEEESEEERRQERETQEIAECNRNWSLKSSETEDDSEDLAEQSTVLIDSIQCEPDLSFNDKEQQKSKKYPDSNDRDQQNQQENDVVLEDEQSLCDKNLQLISAFCQRFSQDYYFFHQNKRNNSTLMKLRCSKKENNELCDVLLLQNSSENIGVVNKLIQNQQAQQNQSVISFYACWEEDSSLFVITEQFYEFTEYPPFPCNIPESLRLICNFLLLSLENKIISLELSARNFCWSRSGQLKLGFEVFKCINKSQSTKASKFMQMETSKKFCQQIIQAISDIKESGVYPQYEELLQSFIQFTEKTEEKCTLQQFLSHPLFC